jgi:glycosyltransferase involved in cell wall biosynthesis
MSATQELHAFGRVSARLAPAASVEVVLVAPYAPRGGGMGRIMDYLGAAHMPGVRFKKLESRGPGSALAAVAPLLRAAAYIIWLAAGRRSAIVHVNMAEGSSVFRKGALLLLARALGLPAILHLHAADIMTFYAGLPRPARALMAFTFRAATVCVVLGEPWRLFLQAKLGVRQARIEILRNGVPRPTLCRFVPRPAPFHFVFLGNLLARKGVADLLHALADPALARLAWQLTIAGGGDSAGFQRIAALRGLSNRVRFAGWLDRAQASHLLACADALVLPSYHEALPLVLAEAASLGVPLITTPVGAIPELFEDGETALFVPPGDRRALAAAMHRLAASPEIAARLGRQARALYERELTLDRFTTNLASIYARHCGVAALMARP